MDPQLNPQHVPHMLKKCPDPKAVQYVRNDRDTPMKRDNNYYRNMIGQQGIDVGGPTISCAQKDQALCIENGKEPRLLFKEPSLSGTKGKIRQQCSLANKLHYRNLVLILLVLITTPPLPPSSPFTFVYVRERTVKSVKTY